MVASIVALPLSHPSSASGGLRGTAQGVRDYLLGPENRLAASVIRRLLQLGQRASGNDLAQLDLIVLTGPSGSGKTHLAHGLAEAWRKQRKRVRLLSGRTLMMEQLAAARQGRESEWRRQLIQFDLLVIDGLHELTVRSTAQRDLAIVLDLIAEAGGRVVITSRHSPQQSSALLSSLRNRLSGGLIVPLAAPGEAVRLMLIQRFMQRHQWRCAKRMAPLLAQQLTLSVPSLLEQLANWNQAAAPQGGVTTAWIQEQLDLTAREQQCSLRSIAAATARYFGFRLGDLKSPTRRQAVVTARGVAMLLARELTDKSLQDIGKFFGGRDHTTVLHGCRQTEANSRRDSSLRQALHDLTHLLTTDS